MLRRSAAGERAGRKWWWLPVMVVVAIGALVMLTGCHTVAGFGEDIEGAGKAMQKADD